jgi:RimJ/RimL family protein N-acetyltransferase
VSSDVLFETSRLRMRPMVDADLDSFVAYRSDPEVARYQSWQDYTRAEGQALIGSMRELRLGQPGQWYQVAIESKGGGALVGDLASKVDASEPREMEVGFTLAPEHHGKGYGTEALTGLLDHAFDVLGMHRAVAITDALNVSAASLLVRVGMRREAHYIENVFFKGAWGSEFLFAVLDREWADRSRTR